MTRLIASVLLASIVCFASSSHAAASPPKLVLQITVDQLRGDLPERFIDRMGKGGFRYLLDRGVVFRDAHHGHANTETIVGHVTLATGAHPATHGMIANVWFDRKSERLVYNIEDERYPLLGDDADVDKSTEIDPTQRKAGTSGRSPANILVSTLSDEIALHSAGRAKIFGVSVKDRGAVALAGHAGKAYWFSKPAGEFVTSRFYEESYPEWVNAWNEKGMPGRYATQPWELLNERASYVYADQDDQEWEVALPGYGRVFPHDYGAADAKFFTTLLTVSPAGDELTADFAKTLIENEDIGQDDITDFLAISFSSTDYVGHFFGPSSLEAEDNLLRLDRTLADLFEFVDEKIGLENTLIVLSADHGGPEAPGLLNQFGIEAAYVDPKKWNKEPAIAAIEKRFGTGEGLILEYYQPYLYLNRKLIREKGLDLDEVSSVVAAELDKFDGVAVAVSSSALASGEVADTTLSRAILNNYNNQRSGDIYVVFEPHRFINDLDGLMAATVHGSPWRYDTFVPLIFAGNGLKPANVYRRVYSIDVAPTLAAWLGTNLPSGSEGRVLPEVAGQRRR